MKKNLLSLFALIFGIALMSNAQIPNAGFESWTSGDPDGWATSNAPPAGLVNITQTSDSHTGSYAVKGDVIDFYGTPMGPVIQSGPQATGFAISEQYHSMELYYKFTSVGGDKFSVNIGFQKSGNPIAQGAVALPQTVSAYTHLTVPMNYQVNEVPDLAIIQISITGPVTGNDVHVGSVMFVDDLLFSMATGVENPEGTGISGKCYPNPASDWISIRADATFTGEYTLSVTDLQGKVVKRLTGNAGQEGKDPIRFSVQDLAPGLYFYSMNAQRGHCQGKFAVGR
jgi:hypothetical protein